jgi:putative flippase GtrA/membrane-associated phospholipid phosphatase
MPYAIALYLISWAAAFLYWNYRLSFEWVAFILFGAALLSGRLWSFLRDWGVFLLAVAAWQLTSPLATLFGFPVHAQDMITFDKTLFFGHVPSVWLQQHLYHPGHLEWYDVLAITMYSLHFLVPLAAGFALWLVNRQLYYRYALAFILCALAGFATYVFYPAMPPWMAAWHCPGGCHHPGAQVYLRGVYDLWGPIMGAWFNPNHAELGTQFLHKHYDLVGAMPSEHAMYPLLAFLFFRKQFGRIAYLFIIYNALVLFSIVYLGQHYVMDAVAGWAYAVLGYVFVLHALPRIQPIVRRWLSSIWSAREEAVRALLSVSESMDPTSPGGETVLTLSATPLKGIFRFLHSELFRFLVVGGGGTALNYLVLTLTYHYLTWPLVPAALLSNETAMVANFFCHEHWTFPGQRRGSRKGRFIRYQFVASGGIFITTVVLAILVHVGLHYLLANAVAIGMAVSWNFTMSQRWAWRRVFVDALEKVA